MHLKLKHLVTDGVTVHQPGSLVDFDDKQGRRLVEIGAAEEVEQNYSFNLTEETDAQKSQQ